MTPAAPPNELQAMDLSRYEGHTPGPWMMWTSNSYRRIGQPHGKDGGVCCAVKHSDGCCDLHFSNGGFDGPDALLLTDAPLLLAEVKRQRDALLAMQRELLRRDVLDKHRSALAGLAASDGTTHWDGCHLDGPKHWGCTVAKLAQSEMVCGELRADAIARVRELEWIIPDEPCRDSKFVELEEVLKILAEAAK